MMNKKVLIVMLVLCINLALASDINCMLKNVCGADESAVIGLTSISNAHATLPSANSAFKICCKGQSLDTTCTASSNKILYLASPSNSHVSTNASNLYNVPICLSMPFLNCIFASQAPDDSYECIVSVSSTTNAHIEACFLNNYPKLFCSVQTPTESLPKNWHSAYGISYPSYERGHISITDYLNKNKTILINNIDNKNYGVVSDFYPVSTGHKLLASIDVNCTTGAAGLALELWDYNKQRIGIESSHYLISQGQWKRIGVESAIPANVAYTTLFFNSSGICYFDNAKLELADSTTEYTGIFNSYDGSLYSIYSGFECCPSTWCWDGNKCIPDMSGNPNIKPVNDFRCVAGNWSYTPELWTWDKGQKGYCPYVGQCLVSLTGNISANGNPNEYYNGNKPQCINDGQSILDNYCSNGKWTTRTKSIAIELLNLVQKAEVSGYSLYCDNYNSSLVEFGDLDYIAGPSKGISQIRSCFEKINAPCVNNFCVLKYNDNSGEKSVFGVSLNINISDSKSLLRALEITDLNYCNNALDSTFQKCNDNNKIWYNPARNMIIFSKEGINLDGSTSILDWFGNIISNLINWFKGSSFEPENIKQSYDFVNQTTRLDKLYLYSGNGKIINAFMELVNKSSFIIADYYNFSTSLCNYIPVAASVDGSIVPIMKCSLDGNVHHIYADNPNAIASWQEMTSELRIK